MQSRASSEIYLFFYHFPIKFIISAFWLDIREVSIQSKVYLHITDTYEI